MTPSRTLIIVNYKSWQETQQAIRSAHLASTEPLEIVVVDNSCDERELEQLQLIDGIRLIASERNSGYAGAVNRGVAESEGEVLFLSNPDIRFGARSIDLLAEHAMISTIAGPHFAWDERGEWHLPPADEVNALFKADEIMAQHSTAWNRFRDLRRADARVRFWQRTEAGPVQMLSGALLALHRNTFDELGGFDDGYELYFEEIDFQRRAKLRGVRMIYVPEAKCRHLYNQSAGKEESSARKFVESELRYLRKWGGTWLLPLARSSSSAISDDLASLPAGATLDVPELALVELTPLSDFRSAAGHFASVHARLPQDVLATSPGELYVRVIDLARQDVVGRWRVERSLQ